MDIIFHFFLLAQLLLYLLHLLFINFNLDGIIKGLWLCILYEDLRFLVIFSKVDVEISVSLQWDPILILIQVVEGVMFEVGEGLADEEVDGSQWGCLLAVEHSDLLLEHYLEQHNMIIDYDGAYPLYQPQIVIYRHVHRNAYKWLESFSLGLT